MANLFDKPNTMGEYVMGLNEMLQALAAFEDVPDIGAIAHHRGRHGDGHCSILSPGVIRRHLSLVLG